MALISTLSQVEAYEKSRKAKAIEKERAKVALPETTEDAPKVEEKAETKEVGAKK